MEEVNGTLQYPAQDKGRSVKVPGRLGRREAERSSLSFSLGEQPGCAAVCFLPVAASLGFLGGCNWFINSVLRVSPCECADRFPFFQFSFQLSVVILSGGTWPVPPRETAPLCCKHVEPGVR